MNGEEVSLPSYPRSKLTKSGPTDAAGALDLSTNNNSNDELDLTTDQVKTVGTLVETKSKELVSSRPQIDTATTSSTKDSDPEAPVLMSPIRQAIPFNAKAKEDVCDQWRDLICTTIGWDNTIECMKGDRDGVTETQQVPEPNNQATDATSPIPSTMMQQFQLQQPMRSSSQTLRLRGGGSRPDRNEELCKLSHVLEVAKLDAT